MPADYECENCHLVFSVGWFHGSPYDKSGYDATTLLVCGASGTEHAVKIAMRDRGPEYYPIYDVTVDEVLAAVQVCTRNRGGVYQRPRCW